MKVPALGSSLLLLLLLSCSVALASSSAEEDQQGLRHWPSGGEHDGDHHYKTTTRESYPHHTTEDYKTTTKEHYPPKTTTKEEYETTTKYYPPKTTTEDYETTTKYYPPKTTTEDETTTKYYPPKTTTHEHYPPKTTTEDYKTTTKEHYPPKTTTEDYKTTTHEEYKTTTHEHYPPKTTTDDYKTTTKEHYPPKTTTEDYKTTTQYYPPKTTTEDYKTTTKYYPPKTTTDGYKTTTKEHYPPKTTTEECHDETTTTKYYPPKTTTEGYKTTTQYYPPKTTTDDYKTTTKEHYPPKTTTEECHDETTTTKYYPPKTTTEDYKTTTQYYPPKTTTDEYKTTSQYYPPKTTTEEHKTTTQYFPPKTTTPECSTTTAQPPKAKMCDFDGLAACRAKGEAKYDRCLERKKAAFASCQSDAQDKFDRCVHSCGQPQRTGPGFAPGEDLQRPGEVDVETYNLRYARCARELDEDKEHCAVQRQVAHAGCKAARECRDLKCLRFIADCEKCPPSTEYPPPPSGSYSCPATDFFGPAADFNVFLSGSDYYIYDLDLVSGDIEGRVAVNGGFRVKSFGTAQRYDCPDTAEQAKKFNLVVNGKMDYTNGQLFCGSSLAVTSMNNPSLRQEALGAANVRVGAGQTVKSLSGVDFGATAGYLQGVSDYFAKYSAGAHGYFRVAQVTPSELRTLSIPAGDYVQVINIKGDGDINFTGFEIDTKLDPSRVIYNVVGGNKVTISAFGLAGHLLALHSDVILENAHVTGNVYARSLTGSGSGQVNLATCSKTS